MLTPKRGLCAHEGEGCFPVNWASQICTGLKVQGLESGWLRFESQLQLLSMWSLANHFLCLGLEAKVTLTIIHIESFSLLLRNYVRLKFICWSQPRVPQNVALFRHRAFTEIIKLNEVICVGSNPIRWEEEVCKQTHTLENTIWKWKKKLGDDSTRQIPPKTACKPLEAGGSEVKVSWSCPPLCNPVDYTAHGILQARILEWVAFPFSRGSSQPRDWTQVSHIAGGFFTSWATGKPRSWGRSMKQILPQSPKKEPILWTFWS